MRLAWVKLNGVRRFVEPQKLVVDGKLTALIGPNEAGKTTVLEALELLTNPDHLEDPARQQSMLSRNGGGEAASPIVEAGFRLEDRDRESLSAIGDCGNATVFRLGVTPDGESIRCVEPAPRRDQGPRRRVARLLSRLQRSPWFKKLDPELQDDVMDWESMWRVDDETLQESSLVGAEQLADALEAQTDENTPRYVRDLPDRIRRLVEHEQREHPAEQAAEALWRTSPDFVQFTPEHRDLRSSYALTEVAHDPPPALENLARLANLDLEALESARVANNQGLVDTITEEANDCLRGALDEAWSQSKVTVRFRPDGGALRISARSEGEGYYQIDERSDGLRTFVALSAFVAVKTATEPILLIDEAETHLHYDAQADLVQMLQTQTVASQVIYTTHSAGALPEDLSAVRSIDPAGDAERSEVRNWFWTENGPGLLPLLLGMGASTMAFLPTRHAVVVEGPSDMLLLPLVFKAALDLETLGFQCVPGLAESNDQQFRVLDNVGSSVAFLTDSDESGKRIAKRLRDQGIDDDRILELSSNNGWTIEDLLAVDLYVDAVNESLRQAGAPEITEDDISAPGRSTSVNLRCQSHSVAPPSKRAVAQTVRKLAHDRVRTVVSGRTVNSIRSLYQEIEERLTAGRRA